MSRHPSFLTRRGLNFWFQRRVPRKLQSTYGHSPLRLRLPAGNPRDAALFARSLATITDTRFLMQDTGSIEKADSREELITILMESLDMSEDIHEPITDVFHSLRHSYKDLMADNDISEATAEKQLGHTPATQTRRYGSPLLRPKEVKRLEKMELPEGLSLEPYYRVLDQVLYYGRIVSEDRYQRDLSERRSPA